MAVQSEIFSTEYGVRSFISTKHIATKQHMAVWLQRNEDSIWVQLSTSNYELINNSAVLISAPNSTIYSQVEIRVADTPDELGSNQSEISIVAGLYDEIVALSGIKNDITTVAGISGDVTTVSSNILDINSVVTNIVPNLTEILQSYTNATIATTKALEASASATSVSNSATTATNQATIATTKASEASASATSASSSATTATTKASEASAAAISASNSATSASTSANTATTKANEASASASLASTSANNASTSETMAYKWSSNPVDTIVETDEYSAFHWATKAQQYASSVDPSNLVHKNGNETITGIKTFSSSPIVPTPIAGNQAVNKEYADSYAMNKVSIRYEGDLNNLLSPGIYDTTPITGNIPIDRYAVLKVIKIEAGEAFNQEFQTVGDYKKYFRYYAGGNWSSWIEIATLAAANSYDLGVGQTWQNVAASRSSGVTYTNYTGKPIQVSLTTESTTGTSSSTFIVQGVSQARTTRVSGGFNTGSWFDIIIPNGATYKLDIFQGGITSWLELR